MAQCAVGDDALDAVDDDAIATFASGNTIRTSGRLSHGSASAWDVRCDPTVSLRLPLMAGETNPNDVDVDLDGKDHDFLHPGDNDVEAEEAAKYCFCRCMSSCKRALDTQSRLPHWSYDRRVARLQNNCSDVKTNPKFENRLTRRTTISDLAAEDGDDHAEGLKVPQPITLNYTCGLARQWSRASAAVLWTGVGFVFVTVFLVGKYKECNAPEIPPWIYAPIGVVILVCCCMEYQASKYAVLPYALQTKKFQFLSVSVRYSHWLVAELLMSSLTMLAFFTNALFFASTMSLLGSGEGSATSTASRNKIEYLWIKLQHEAVWGFLPIWQFVSPSIVAGAFFVIVVFQLFSVYVHTEQLPRRSWDKYERDINHGVCYQWKQNEKTGEWFGAEVRWSTWAKKWKWSNWHMTFSEAIFKQSSITGWCTFRQMSLSYPLSQLKGIEQRLGEGGEMARQAVRRLKPVVTQAWQSLLFSTFLKTALQLNLQVTLFMLYRALNGESRSGSIMENVANANFTQLGSILLAIGTSLTFEFDLFYTVSRHCWRIENNKDVKSYVHECNPANWKKVEGPTSDTMCPYCERGKKKEDPMCNQHWDKKSGWEDYVAVWRAFVSMLVLFAICNFLIFYAIVKLFMSFVCPDSLWNYHGWCVNIDDDRTCLSGLNSTSV